MIKLCLLLASLVIVGAINDGYYTCYVVSNHNKGGFEVKKGKNESGLAWGFYNDTINELGYSFLEIYTNPNYEDQEIAFAAGYLEGYITHKQIYDSWRNFYESTFYNSTDEFMIRLYQFIDHNIDYVLDNIHANSQNNYWSQINTVYFQLVGMTEGYNDGAKTVNDPGSEKTLTVAQLWLLNSMGDLDDLIPALISQHNLTSFGSYSFDNIDDQISWAIMNGHCSSLVKLNWNYTEIFAAHDMWSDFSQMLEIFKYYNFQFNKGQATQEISFSSYPGMISSEDDFYITSNQLVVMETTNGIFNLSLYSQVKPESLLYWFRVIVANRLASNGSEWTQLMSEYNSGTYNNQWIIVDMKLFLSGTSQQPSNLLWIGSQIPGYFESADVTSVFNTQGYWPSYNIPYFPNIFQMAGYDQLVEKDGDLWSYDMCPRAQIFRKRAPMVDNIEDLQALMRYNDWEHDPLSLGCPLNQIASRLDLAPLNATGFCARATFGAINSKVTSNVLAADYSAWIVAGPTHETLPPFAWTESIENEFPNSPHHGHPKVFNFTWIYANPNSF